jgi:hypothetical protein
VPSREKFPLTSDARIRDAHFRGTVLHRKLDTVHRCQDLLLAARQRHKSPIDMMSGNAEAVHAGACESTIARFRETDFVE